MKSLQENGAQTIEPPLFNYLGLLGLGLLMEQFQPIPIFSGSMMAAFGLLTLIIGIAGLLISIYKKLKSHHLVVACKTTAASHLYYLIIYCGLAIIFNSFWAILFIALFLYFKSLEHRSTLCNKHCS